MSQSTVQPVLATKREAASLLGLSVYQVDRLIEDGALRAVKIRTSVRVVLDDVHRIAKEGTP
ncbi:MAG TPA: hypothetical protein DEQ43_04910 [Nocardioides bacterium]|nr:hypothetical protein [Nocardioides sp.]